MKNIDKIFSASPFGLRYIDKKKIFLDRLKHLYHLHYSKSKLYRKLININKINKINDISEFPFISIRLFKELEIKSIENKKIFKTIYSSGTSGKKSKIFLDKKNANSQTKILNNIASNFLSKDRMPMLIVDSSKIFDDKNHFSARSAAIIGFSIFSSNRNFLLNKKLNINLNILKKLNTEEKYLFFGFTNLVWDKFLKKLKNKKLNFKNSILLHGGGWKKLTEKSINEKKFKKEVKNKLNIKKVINYYGMVEQVGSIFFECEKGFFHSSIFSDVIVRDQQFNNLGYKKKGILQLISIIPESYPGHNIITEDEAEIFGTDNCKCGRMGK